MNKYIYRYRSSLTGHFVSATFAARNPATTMRERFPRKVCVH